MRVMVRRRRLVAAEVVISLLRPECVVLAGIRNKNYFSKEIGGLYDVRVA
jgi:hypothetical protein